MLFSSLVSLLALAAGALARPGHKGHNKNDNTPSPPPTDYLFTVNITSGEVVVLGDTPAGERTFQPIIGGTFSGPKLQGKFPRHSAAHDEPHLLPVVRNSE